MSRDIQITQSNSCSCSFSYFRRCSWSFSYFRRCSWSYLPSNLCVSTSVLLLWCNNLILLLCALDSCVSVLLLWCSNLCVTASVLLLWCSNQSVLLLWCSNLCVIASALLHFVLLLRCSNLCVSTSVLLPWCSNQRGVATYVCPHKCTTTLLCAPNNRVVDLTLCYFVSCVVTCFLCAPIKVVDLTLLLLCFLCEFVSCVVTRALDNRV